MILADPRIALNELVTQITALQLPASFGEDVAAFDKVRVFDLQDLAKAFEELFVYANRVAFVALEGVTHQNTVTGRTLTTERSLNIKVLFSDRRFSDRQKALIGDDTTPGALLLEKLLVDHLAGELPSGAVVLPGSGQLIGLEFEKRTNETGRIIFGQDFTIATDWTASSLTRKAKVVAT